jgi:hypothetical protein
MEYILTLPYVYEVLALFGAALFTVVFKKVGDEQIEAKHAICERMVNQWRREEGRPLTTWKELSKERK